MTKNMPEKPIVTLDSNELIFGLTGNKQYPKILIDNLKDLSRNYDFRINRQILKEVLDNIPNQYKEKFFKLVNYGLLNYDNKLIDKKLIKKYKNLKLKKGDNVIAAFTELINADFLISENRHFLKWLQTRKFKILNAEQFLKEIIKF